MLTGAEEKKKVLMQYGRTVWFSLRAKWRFLCYDSGFVLEGPLEDPPDTWGAERLLYLSTGRVAGAGPRGGGLHRTVRALCRQPAAAVRVAEALAVLLADLSVSRTAGCLHVCRL